MEDGAQAPATATDVTAPVATAVEQAPATPASSTEETKELEVVHEGKPVSAHIQQEDTTDVKAAEDAEARDAADKADDTTAEDDQPREENKRDANSRIRQLNAEKKELEQKLHEALSGKVEEYDVDKAIAEGKDPALAEVEALKQDSLNQKLNTAVTNLNLQIQQEANDVERDFAYMDPTAKRSQADIEFAEEVKELWFTAADVQLEKDEKTGVEYFTQAKVPLYDFVKKMDKLRSSQRESGATDGQRNAERQLAAVEIPTGPAPRTDRSNDAKLSADEYAKKYNLPVVQG